ncbi:Type IV pilus assembly protein PilX [Pseudomonas syringae pv. cilantro]|uniref:Type IV pilus assembly protein PilX n=2 Tax=Pseudomonas syringae group TaxID=136849 RepID=A0A0N0GFL2_PSESX|nr:MULTISPECIES: PilX N-terminal domain-containing pilus assembly protein [Pseudomonas syringae group]KPC31732.1 Type IV pilus assembly protein PilX [Pseudomonas syringae pv. cilantro]KPW70110.1 Type IV pilus assembly protein PilX [Pseudomonas syringae pv. coriandricola]RMN07591.1 Type IV pilus assembly protein PilX [Pseudomonas syringae pv. coriandricola]
MNKIVRLNMTRTFPAKQRGMVLLVSLVFLLLLTLLGISSMQNATLQEKMAGSVMVRNQSFQMAEAALRIGESAIKKVGFSMEVCNSLVNCAPPTDFNTVKGKGAGSAGVTWVEVEGGGVYAIQNLGNTITPIKLPTVCSGTSAVTLYRITAVAPVSSQTAPRTVLESMYVNC